MNVHSRGLKAQIVKDALRRFQHLPLMTIARHILNTNGDYFDNNLEKIRDSVRNYAGKHGDAKRQAASDKSLFREGAVAMPPTWRKVRTPYKLPPGVWLVVADLHIPFHDPKAIEAAAQYGHAEHIDGILILGDLFDCAALSKWDQPKRNFNREVEAVIDFLDYLRGEFPDAKIVYKPGNHEFRLPRYFMSKAEELSETPLSTMETVLGFEQRGIEFLDYYQIVMAGKLPMIHGHEVQTISKAVNMARGLFLRTKTYSLCAHGHTTSMHPEKDLNGNLITCWSIGCLCDLSPDYAPYNNWNHGFALVNVEKDGSFEVINRRILPNGKVV